MVRQRGVYSYHARNRTGQADRHRGRSKQRPAASGAQLTSTTTPNSAVSHAGLTVAKSISRKASACHRRETRSTGSANLCRCTIAAFTASWLR
jgi:hypothetical protein